MSSSAPQAKKPRLARNLSMAGDVKDVDDDAEGDDLRKSLQVKITDEFFNEVHIRGCIVNNFNPFQCFGYLPTLETIRFSNGSRLLIPISVLFDTDKLLHEDDEKYHESLNTDIFWDPPDASEVEVLVSLADKVLSRIIGKDAITFENKHTELIKGTGFSTDKIGLGNECTWHGSPDMKIDSVCVIATEDNAEEVIESISTTSFEGKKKFCDADLAQVIATCVTFSFVSNNINGELNALVPCLLINTYNMLLCLYDCQLDILLVSTSLPLHVQPASCIISSSAIKLLYLVVNHRKYLRKLKDTVLTPYLDLLKSQYQDNCSKKTLEALRMLTSLRENAQVKYPRGVSINIQVTKPEQEFYRSLQVKSTTQ